VKAWISYAAAALLGLLGLFVLPDCVRDARLLSRLPHDGLRIAAEIIRIDEESVSRDDGPSEIVETATVRYAVAGKQYEARHGLPGPIRSHKPGGTLALLVSPDDPGRGYSTHLVTGSWIMSLALPGILFGGAALFGFVGSLLRNMASGDAPEVIQARRRKARKST
jgi:hypothetical protein